MIMTSLETMTNVITNSNVSKITAAITLQIMFDKGRCHGDILRKQVNIICHVDRIFGNTRNIDFNRADYTWLRTIFLTHFRLTECSYFVHNSTPYTHPSPILIGRGSSD